MRQKDHGLLRIWKALGYSLKGLYHAFLSEAAFRTDLLIFILLAPLACFLHVTSAERALLIGSLFLILIAELVNTAIEAVVDRIGEEPHALSGAAKDVGSAIVFVSLLNAACLWAVILL